MMFYLVMESTVGLFGEAPQNHPKGLFLYTSSSFNDNIFLCCRLRFRQAVIL